MIKDHQERIFIEIALPQTAIKKAQILQSKLKSISTCLNFTTSANLHATLIFLGLQSKENIAKVSDILSSAIKDYQPIAAHFDNIILLPNSNNARIIAVKIIGPELNTLYYNINNILLKNGLIDRNNNRGAYLSHITLARCKKALSLDNIISINKINIPLINFKLDALKIISSKLTEAGPKYKTLSSFSF